MSDLRPEPTAPEPANLLNIIRRLIDERDQLQELLRRRIEYPEIKVWMLDVLNDQASIGADGARYRDILVHERIDNARWRFHFTLRGPQGRGQQVVMIMVPA